MKNIVFFSFLVLVAFQQLFAYNLKSPNGNLILKFTLAGNGIPTYALSLGDKQVIENSRLGFELVNDDKSFLDDFEVGDIQTSSFDVTWQPVWGEEKDIRNQYLGSCFLPGANQAFRHHCNLTIMHREFFIYGINQLHPCGKFATLTIERQQAQFVQ